MAQHADAPEGALSREALAHPTKAHVTGDREGGMDITTQEATFVGFMRFTTRMVILIVALLIFLALVNG